MGAALPEQRPDLSSLCEAFMEHSPWPMATTEGAGHIVRYVNPALCRLMQRPQAELVGKPFRDMMPEKDECGALLDRVFRMAGELSHTARRIGNRAKNWRWNAAGNRLQGS